MNAILVLHYDSRCKTPAVPAVWFCVCWLIVLSTLSRANADCKLHKHNSSSSHHEREVELLKKLDPLKGHLFNLTDGKYNYTLGICTDVREKSVPGAGLVQRQIAGGEIFSLGSYNDVEIMAGTDWMFLTYFNGTAYNSHCNQTNRTSRIMVICDPNVVMGEFRKLEERLQEGSDDCFYLFEVGSKVSCNAPRTKEEPHLSSGSTFCIIVFTVAGIYLLLGFLYQRIVVGAKGLEQIPNYAFWRSFGNLQADGCDYICRCGPRQESQAYRGIDDRIRTDEERDDQLLNM